MFTLLNVSLQSPIVEFEKTNAENVWNEIVKKKER